MTPARLRVAPSPTGDPHLGTAYQALFDKAYAEKTGGQFVLRIEDTDRARYVETSEQQIYDTLAWLGLDPDESPALGGPYAPYRQSERLDTYKPYVDQLIADGHAYYCYCTTERLGQMREQQLAAKEDTGYDRLCYGLSKEERAKLPGFQEQPVVRMLIPDDVELEFDDLINGTISAPRPDDQVILKADGFPTYHLAVVVDDHLMGITHMIRGQEWISSTPKQMLLYKWLGWELPPIGHTPLLRNPDHSKMSKRKNPASRLTWFQEQGYQPEALLNYLMLLGYPPVHEGDDFQTWEEFVADFDWGKISPAGAIFDNARLNSINAEHLRRKTPGEFAALVEPWVRQVVTRDIDIELLAANLQPRTEFLAQIPEQVAFLQEPESIQPEMFVNAKRKTTVEGAMAVLAALQPKLTDLDDFSRDSVFAVCDEIVAQLETKRANVLVPLGVALSGRSSTPGGGADVAAMLGKEETLRRLTGALALLG